MGGIHSGSVFSKEQWQFLRYERQCRVHREESVFGYDDEEDPLNRLETELIQVNRADEAETSHNGDTLERRSKNSRSIVRASCRFDGCRGFAMFLPIFEQYERTGPKDL